jgi:hypothetical protein
MKPIHNIGRPVVIGSHESGSEGKTQSGRGCRFLRIFSPPTHRITLIRRDPSKLIPVDVAQSSGTHSYVGAGLDGGEAVRPCPKPQLKN